MHIYAYAHIYMHIYTYAHMYTQLRYLTLPQCLFNVYP